MKRKTILTLGAAATAAVIGAIPIPAIAGGWGPHDGWGPRQMMQMMHGDQAGVMQDGRGSGVMMQRGGHGPMGMTGMADNPVYQSFDSDEDGTVTAAELEAGIAALHTEHDADGNGALSSDEFAALFAEVTRGMAERPFTMLDADDDGEISAEEMAFPAQMMARMQRMHGADKDRQ
ncbi:EF-hand domain-containing protein [Rhodosalinus sp. 5P4]|uniref:EF-hand domain-containing protein n=1 Tax=Rhodosalinus sp. 5P4 TaxID=3239196 RepID=UPI003524F1B5